jgi:membrane-bound metal-dependent hydrolase YbcI (DUF457 family)
MPLPAAHMLVGAAAAEGVDVLTPVPRYRAWLVGAVFALLPDIDYGFRLLTGEFAPIERSATHSLLATTVVVLAVWLVAGRRWAAVAGAGYASHLAADLMQHQPRSSVALLWPLQERGMETILPLFPYVPVQRGEGVLAAATSLLQGYRFAALLQETAIAAGIFFGVLVLTGWIRNRRDPAGRHSRRSTRAVSG